MELQYYVNRLDENAKVIRGLVAAVPIEQAGWKPSSKSWSIVEVINHLYDEEVEDFRPRLKNTLTDPMIEWSPISPAEWAVERDYASRVLADSVEMFLSERRRSLEFLNELEISGWDNFYNHPSGKIRAGDLLASWVAHDFLHIKQMTRLHYDFLRGISKPFATDYAGEWK